MNRCVYGVIIALLLFNSLSTTAILVIFVTFTNQLIEKLETFPPMIDTRINNIVGTLDATVDDKLDSVVVQFNRTLYTFVDMTIDSFSDEFNDTIISMYQLKTSVDAIQNDLTYLRNRSSEFENRAFEAPSI